MRRCLGFALVALTLSGCAFRVGDLSIVSSRNVALEVAPIRPNVEGQDCSYMLLFIPFGSLVPSIEEAMDQAMQKVPEGNIMTDIAVYNDVVFTYIFNQSCVRVKGTVGRLE